MRREESVESLNNQSLLTLKRCVKTAHFLSRACVGKVTTKGSVAEKDHETYVNLCVDDATNEYYQCNTMLIKA